MARRPSGGRGSGGLSLSRKAKNVKNRAKSFATGGYEFTSKRKAALEKAQEASARARRKLGNAGVFAQANAASTKTRIKNRTTKAVGRVAKAVNSTNTVKNFKDKNFGGAKNAAKRAMSSNAAIFARANANSAKTRIKKKATSVANTVKAKASQTRKNYNDKNFGGAKNMAKRAASGNAAIFARANANSAVTRTKNAARNAVNNAKGSLGQTLQQAQGTANNAVNNARSTAQNAINQAKGSNARIFAEANLNSAVTRAKNRTNAQIQNAVAAGNSAAARVGSTAAALTGTAQQLYSQARNAASDKANQLAAQTRQAAEGPANRLDRLTRSLTGNERQYGGRGSSQNSFSFNQGAAANAKTTAPATPGSRGSAVQSKPKASPSTRGQVASKTKFIQREIKAAQKRGATAASARRTAESKWKNYQTQQRKNSRVKRT